MLFWARTHYDHFFITTFEGWFTVLSFNEYQYLQLQLPKHFRKISRRNSEYTHISVLPDMVNQQSVKQTIRSKNRIKSDLYLKNS